VWLMTLLYGRWSRRWVCLLACGLAGWLFIGALDSLAFSFPLCTCLHDLSCSLALVLVLVLDGATCMNCEDSSKSISMNDLQKLH
jgi:hypothetical protein